MTVRTMNEVGAADVAVGQVWAAPPGAGGDGRPGHRGQWQVAALGQNGVTVARRGGLGEWRDGVDVTFGTLLADWVLVSEAP